MQQYTRLKEDAGEDDVGLLLVVDAEIFRLDAVDPLARRRRSAAPAAAGDRATRASDADAAGGRGEVGGRR